MAALNGRLHLGCLVMATMWLPPYAVAADDEALAPAQPPAQHNALDQPQAQKLLQMVTKMMPDGVLTPLDPASPIISGQGLDGGHDNRRVRYRLFALRTMGPIYTPKLQVIKVDGRPGMIFSSEDLTAGLAGLDHWGIFGYAPQSARNLVVNGALLTLAESP